MGMRINPIRFLRILMIIAAFALGGCIDISSSTPPSSNTKCTSTDNGPNMPPTTTCTTEPTGGSHWGFFL
jgi:hypothetical protein